MLKTKMIVPPVPTPNIQPTTNRSILYVGEDLNVTCTSSVMGAVFTWRAVDIKRQTLILPNTTINISAYSSVLVFKPITSNFGNIAVDITCNTTFPENENIIGGDAFQRFQTASK